MKKPIIFDCDGVLLDYAGGIRKMLWEVDGIETDPAGPCSYDMMAWMGAPDRDFVRDRIRRFNSNEGGYFANLDPVPGAVEAVAALREAGHPESVLTQCNTDPATVAARQANLEAVFGGFSEIRFVEMGGTKRPHLERLPASWFIEDNLGNAHLGVETGHDTMLIEHLHNRERTPDEQFHRVSGWREVLALIQAPKPSLEFNI